MRSQTGGSLEKSGRTLLAKIWDQHVIARLSEDTDLLHVDRHLLHDLGGSRGLLDLKKRGLTVHNPELTFATPDHAISTAHGRAGTIQIGQELLAALRVETAAARHRAVRYRPARPGHRPCHRAGAGPEPARLPDRLRRQPYLHPWRARRAGVRHRIERTDPCAGDASADPAPAQNHAREVRGQASARRHRQGPDPCSDRPCRGRRRHRLCRRICRQRDPRYADRRAADASAISRSSSAPRWAWSRRTRKPTSTSAAGATRRKARCGSRRSGMAAAAKRSRCGVRPAKSDRCRQPSFRR